jgi:DmsE family decaheme c-type cytochrome
MKLASPPGLPAQARRLHAVLAGPLALLAAALLLSLVAAEARAAEPRKDLALKDDAVCTRCHDETESYPVLAIGKTRHGTVADGRAPTCVSCHGTSRSHVENLRKPGEDGRPKPDRTFGGQLLAAPAADRVDRYFGQAGKRTSTPAQERNAACIGCHEGGKRTHWAGSAHDSRDVACTSCHQLHTQHDKVRDRATQAETCFACHKEQRAQVSRVSHHPVKEGKVGCSDCHNPHGSAGAKQLVRDSVVDTCYACHMEKRGPFLFNHQPVTDDCTICHNPHGSNVAPLLKSRAPFLCQQCHEPTSHRGNVPGLLTGTGSAAGTRGVTQARSCLNCHTQIHGGNNPTNNAESRSMRR